MAAGIELLTSKNITRVAQALVDQTLEPQALLFYNRASRPQMSDDELTARERRYVFAADIVAPDSKAPMRESGEITFEKSAITKIKHGFGLSETYVQLLTRIEDSRASAIEQFTFDGYIARNTRDLILGCQQREEAMLVGMLLDGFTYDRLGVHMSGSWGMPSDLKATPGGADWDNTAATPITDIITLKVYAQTTYGQVFNRLTMSLACLQNLIATTQFQDMYRATIYRWDVPSGVVITADALQFASFVGQLVGMTVEVYDGRYREYQNDGSIITPTRFLPEEKVLFTNSADDNGAAWDFGQAEIMESKIGRLGGTNVIGGGIQEGFGPIAYATQANGNLDPAGLIVYAVDRGAPRKSNLTCSAYITAYTP